MNQARPMISPIMLLIVLILFALPIVVVQNNGHDIYTYSGAELMRSYGINLRDIELRPINVAGELISVFFLSLIAFILSLFSFYKPKFSVIVGTISGMAALVLVVFVFRIIDFLDSVVVEKLTDNNVALNFKNTFFVMFGSLMVSSGWNFIWYYRLNHINKKNVQIIREASIKCPSCSGIISSEVGTCKHCGLSRTKESNGDVSSSYASNNPIHPRNIPVSESTRSSKPKDLPLSERKSNYYQKTTRRNNLLIGLLIAILTAAGGYKFIMPLLWSEIPDISGDGIIINPFPVEKGHELKERITFNAVLNTQDAEVTTFLKAFELDKLMVEGEQERKIKCVGGGEGRANALDLLISDSPTKKLSLIQSSLQGKRIEVRKNEKDSWKASAGLDVEEQLKKLELHAIEADIARLESVFENKKRKLNEVWESETGYFRAGTMFQNLSGKTIFEFRDTSSNSYNGTHLCAIIKYSVTLTGELRSGVFSLDDRNSSLQLTGTGTLIYDLIDQVILEDKLEGDITLRTKLDKFIDDFSEITYSGRFSTTYSTLPSLNPATKPTGSEVETEQNGNINLQNAHPINPYFPYVRGKSYYFATNDGQDCNFVLKSRIDFIDSFSQKITFPNGNTADAVIMSFTEKYLVEDIYHHEWLSLLLPAIISNNESNRTNCCELEDISQIPKCNCFVVTATEVWFGELDRGNPVNLKRILNLGGNIEGRFGLMKRELQDYDTYYKNYRSYCKDLDASLNFAIAPIKDSRLIRYTEETKVGSCCQAYYENDRDYTCSIIWSTKGIYSIICSWHTDFNYELQLVE